MSNPQPASPAPRPPQRADGVRRDLSGTRRAAVTAGDRRWPLRVAEDAFLVLCDGPRPLSVDGRALPGLPDTVVALTQVRDLILDPATGYPIRQAVWEHVVERARRDGPEWVIGAVGLAMPGLKAMSARLRTGTDRDGQDVEAEMLTGFLTALRDLDVASGRIAARLCWAGYHAGERFRHQQPARAGLVLPLPASAPPPAPWGHPDLVLDGLVTRGVLSEYEAELIGRTRLEGMRLEDLADGWGVPASTLAADRSRAERRVVGVLTTEGKVTVRSRNRLGVPSASAGPACHGAGVFRPDHRPGGRDAGCRVA
jgi:hypothetical protein